MPDELEFMGVVPINAKAENKSAKEKNRETIQNIVDNISKDIEIYIVCGHFENNKYNLRLTQNPQIKAIYTSNSLNKKQFGNLKVFDIKDLI